MLYVMDFAVSSLSQCGVIRAAKLRAYDKEIAHHTVTIIPGLATILACIDTSMMEPITLRDCYDNAHGM
jgi:hypothetical protein